MKHPNTPKPLRMCPYDLNTISNVGNILYFTSLLWFLISTTPTTKNFYNICCFYRTESTIVYPVFIFLTDLIVGGSQLKSVCMVVYFTVYTFSYLLIIPRNF